MSVVAVSLKKKAHRNPKLMVRYAEKDQKRGLRVIIAGAGRCADRPVITDSLTTLPVLFILFFFFSSRRRHTRLTCDWSSDVCSSDLLAAAERALAARGSPATDRP